MRHCTHCAHGPQAAHATHEESDENFALEYGLLSPREEEGGLRDYGLGDNSGRPPNATAAGGGIDDEDLYGEYGDGYGGYGDPYGAGEMDRSALPSATAAAAVGEPRRALTQGPPPTRALSRAAPPKPSLSERVVAADARLGDLRGPPSAAPGGGTAADAVPVQEVDPAVVADMRRAFDLIDTNGNV